MAFDFGPGTDDNRHATRTPSGCAARHTRLSVTVSTWMLAALGAVAIASCSSLDSGSKSGGTGGKAATGGKTGSGGMVGGTGGSGTGGSATGGNGDGGAGVDAAVDAPATDAPVPCGPGNDCCPNDPNKTDPGMCGCGVAESSVDTDTDGVPDCIDPCPTDPGKFSTAGVCGCGIPDIYTDDTDGDGTPDCLDECPKDKTRIKRGACGCGVPDTAAPLCLAHRYTFDDVAPASDGGVTDGGADGGAPLGPTVHDSLGTANGVAVRLTLDGSGAVTFPAGTADPTTDHYIQLPAGTISSLGNSATFEAWVNWNDAAGAFWQRIFDFGGNGQTQGTKGIGNSFIFATGRGAPVGVTTPELFVSFITLGNPVTEILAPSILPSGTKQQVVVVVDATPAADAGAPSMILYLNGVRVLSTPLGNQLNNIADVNNWLGRSQFSSDISFSGIYYDFRIFSTALTAAQVAANFAAGSDTLPN